MGSFADHFSGRAADYARHRPTYPAALFDWLAAQVPQGALAWDVATGNGQAALALAERVGQVIATDASPQQLEQAPPHPRLQYRLLKDSLAATGRRSLGVRTPKDFEGAARRSPVFAKLRSSLCDTLHTGWSPPRRAVSPTTASIW